MPAALTRAQQLVVVVGSPDALATAVRNVSADIRRSQLPQRLRLAALEQGLLQQAPKRFPPLPPRPASAGA